MIIDQWINIDTAALLISTVIKISVIVNLLRG